tara:strand:+ start:242 stop:436 length:195 start_codon:yes stop_codon:yes gene_type:complete
MTEIEYKERLRVITDSCKLYEDCSDGSYEACIDSKVYKLDKELRIQSEALKEYDEAIAVTNGKV